MTVKWVKRQDYSEFVLEGCCLTIGNFDGLHQGHRQLVSHVLEMSREFLVPSLLLSFSPHPIEVLMPETKFLSIFTREDLANELSRLGIDYFVEIPFSKELSALSAKVFFQDHLCAKFQPQSISVGYDYSFGHNKEGDIDLLSALCKERDIKFKGIKALEQDGQPISSTRIRNALSEGNVGLARQYLGRDYYLEGIVVKGEQLGRKLGFPTANMPLQREVPLLNGVYETELEVDGSRFRSISNIGTKPTMGANYKLNVETHILDQGMDLYGKNIKVYFKDFVRPEQKFSSAESLKAQILKDIEAIKKL